MFVYNIVPSDHLSHHGILGQKWGQKNGPPYPLGGGDYSKTEQKAIGKSRRSKNSIYNKKHFDTVLEENTELSTLSYDKDRTKGTDMFYATYTPADKDLYNMMFNKKLDEQIIDSDGTNLGTGKGYKFRISNDVQNQIKVASEDSGAKAFTKLYSDNRDFYNFVIDPERMEKLFVDEKYKYKGYRQAKDVLDKIQNEDYTPTDEDLKTVYRMFNYVLPAQGSARETKDVTTQRARFFSELKKEGYGAVLDTNDAIYGSFKAQSPVIVFDMDSLAYAGASETTLNDKRMSSLRTIGRRALGIRR